MNGTARRTSTVLGASPLAVLAILVAAAVLPLLVAAVAGWGGPGAAGPDAPHLAPTPSRTPEDLYRDAVGAGRAGDPDRLWALLSEPAREDYAALFARVVALAGADPAWRESGVPGPEVRAGLEAMGFPTLEALRAAEPREVFVRIGRTGRERLLDVSWRELVRVEPGSTAASATLVVRHAEGHEVRVPIVKEGPVWRLFPEEP
jgi:hypothetical protein